MPQAKTLRSLVLLSQKFDCPGWLNVAGEHPANELVPLNNGLLHVPTRNLLPHTPSLFVQHALLRDLRLE